MANPRKTVIGSTSVVLAISTALFPIGSLGEGQAFQATASNTNLLPFTDASGVISSYSTTGAIDFKNPFFQNLGTNQRTCVTCHSPAAGWSVTPSDLRTQFMMTGGTHPVFRTNDGSTCDTVDVSTVAARRVAYSLLLTKGLYRIAIPVPANAEFTVMAADNPYGCNSTSTLSLYRRPLPTANVSFLSTVMWDGRESLAGNTLEQNLAHQANSATMGHAQAAAPLTDAQQHEIVKFETALFTAQAFDFSAGNLHAAGALGGPKELSTQPFYIGINDPLGGDPTGGQFNPVVFTIYSAWEKLSGGGSVQAARASVGRGEAIFNTRQFNITGVGGLNDLLGTDPLPGTCTLCHDSPNVGHHSISMPLNLGINDVSLRTPDMPLITLTHNVTGETIQTMDPGRALVTGKWVDIGKTKGPILRGLAARPPYFHNGSSSTLTEVVNFYNTRFSIGLSDQDKTDLVNFLKTL